MKRGRQEADRQRRDADRVAWLPAVLEGKTPYGLEDPRAADARLGRAG